ncbi:MAG: helix-turn-helix domain-containing protein [Ruminococcaceae bacterium]|nr:helix-turn-helix domain-containing protein [Oscillospiraceae bacterium]
MIKSTSVVNDMGNKMYKYLLRAQTKDGKDIIVCEKFVSTPSALHWHNYIEIELIIDGNGYNLLNGNRYDLSRGSFYILRLIDFHEVHPEPNLHIITMGIDDSLLSEEILGEFTSGQPFIYKLNEEDTVIMEQLLRLCMDENNRKEPDKRYIRHLLSCILLRILKLVPDNNNTFPLVEKPIQAAILYMHMHFRENPSLSELAKIAHYNTSHFSATFHKELGVTYCEYLNMLKINYAKELLCSTDLKVTEICFECGFTSHSNFLRLFKEKTGISPIAFRKKQEEGVGARV